MPLGIFKDFPHNAVLNILANDFPSYSVIDHVKNSNK